VYELCSHCDVSLLPERVSVLDILVSDVLDVEAMDQQKFAYVNRQRGRQANEEVDSLMSMTGEICVVVSISSDSMNRLLHPHMVNITFMKKSVPCT
jgi:hypothetical protein